MWNGLFWILAGNFVYAFSQYGMLVALAKVSTPRHVGQYALALAIATPVMFFCNLQLRAILASDAGRSYQFFEYWRVRIFTVPIAAIVVAAAAVIGCYGTETAIVVLVVGAAKSLESLADLCYGANQRNCRLDLVGKSLLMKGPLSLGLLATVTWATQNVAAGMAAVGLAWFLLLQLYDLPNVRIYEPLRAAQASTQVAWDWTRELRLVAIGFPLAVSISLLTLSVVLPNILVARYFGEHKVGIYAALAGLAWAGVPLINALGQTAMPKFGDFYVAGDYARLQAAVIGLAVVGGLLGLAGLAVVWVCGEPLIAAFYGREYGGHVDVLTWLMLAAGLLFSSRFIADALTAMRCVGLQLFTQAATVLIVLVGCMAVLPQSGLVAVAKVVAAAFGVRWMLLFGGFLSMARKLHPAAVEIAAAETLVPAT